jgi:hypothetical protein
MFCNHDVHFKCTSSFCCALLNKFGFCLVFKSAPGAHKHLVHLLAFPNPSFPGQHVRLFPRPTRRGSLVRCPRHLLQPSRWTFFGGRPHVRPPRPLRLGHAPQASSRSASPMTRTPSPFSSLSRGWLSSPLPTPSCPARPRLPSTVLFSFPVEAPSRRASFPASSASRRPRRWTCSWYTGQHQSGTAAPSTP